MHVVTIGGSDAGISAALRIRELDPSVAVTVVVADTYPNFSICGIPYYISGEVGHWSNLAHRSRADLEATGIRLLLDSLVTEIDVAGRRLSVRGPDGDQHLTYDALVVGTGAVPARPPIGGLHELSADDGVHLLHSIGDTFALQRSLDVLNPRTALIVGAGYVGLEMAEGLTARGLAVTQVEMLPEVLPTVDAELGGLVHEELTRHGVAVHTSTTVTRISRNEGGGGGRLRIEGRGADQQPMSWDVDLVLVVVGVRPDTDLLVRAGAQVGARGAVIVDEAMATGLPQIWAAGDCVVTHHRQIGVTYLPLGTTAHKQGRIAGENAIGGRARFAGSLGTQVVKVFDLVAARTGLREHEARLAGHRPATSQSSPDDHKAYYPGSQPITIRVTGDADTGQFLGAQLVGRRGTETAKRVDTYAVALFHAMSVEDISALDLSYTPPLGSPWDAVQLAAQAWGREHRPPLSPLHPLPHSRGNRPTVLFVCEHNAGRSQLAAGLAVQRAEGRVNVLSAGTAPDEKVSDVMLASLAELGIDRSDQVPTQVTQQLVDQADVIVALKPDLPITPPAGAAYEIWPLPDPADWDLDGIRPLRDHLDGLVQQLIARILHSGDTDGLTGDGPRTSDGTERQP